MHFEKYSRNGYRFTIDFSMTTDNDKLMVFNSMQYILLMILKNRTVNIRPKFNAIMRDIEQNSDSIDGREWVLNFINVFTKVKLSNMMILNVRQYNQKQTLIVY